MAKQSQTTISATAAKTQQPKPAPNTVQEVMAAPELAEMVGGTGPTAFQHGANPLGNPNLQRVPRQMIASRIGQVHGNGHLQQVVAFVKQNKQIAPYQPNQSKHKNAPLLNPNRSVQDTNHLSQPVTDENADCSDLPGEEELTALWGENVSTSFSATEPPPSPTGASSLQLQQQEEPTGVEATAVQTQPANVQRELFEDPVKTIRKDVADFAHNIPGYSLLTYVLGRDPISEEAVDRTPTNLVRAILGIIPGGEQIFQNLQESGALQDAFNWLEEQLVQLNLTWEMIKGLLARAWDAIDITDALHPIDAFNQKIKPIFLPVLTRLKNFALAVGQKILEFVLAGAMKLAGPMGERVMGILQQLGGAFSEIVKNPLAFLSRLWTSIKTGLGNFVENIGEHLQTGFIGWLTGTVAKMGIRLPPKWDLAGIFSFVMQVLNIDLSQILGRLGQMLGLDLNMFQTKVQELITIYHNEGGIEGLAKYGLTQIIGEEHMHSLMQVVHIFDILRNGEIGKLWALVKQHLSSLKEMIFGQIKEFLIKQVVQEGIKWVLSLLDPTLVAQIVKLCQSVYRIFSFFLERAQQILPLVEAVTSSLAAVASGNIGVAAGAIENALSRALPMAMGFLSSLLIGDITGPVQNILKKAQGMIQAGIDAILNSKPVQMVTGFIKRVIGKITALAKTGYNKAKGWATTGINKLKDKLGFGAQEPNNDNASDNKNQEQPAVAADDEDINIHTDFNINGEEHEINNQENSHELTLSSSTPTLLSEHPNQDVRNSYNTYLQEIANAKSPTAKKEAANRNLRIIVFKIKAAGAADAPGASAPGIGTIDRHKNQQNKLRRTNISVWYLESEHVIPRAFVNTAFMALAQAGIPAGSIDYQDMHTILIYKGAAKNKTNGPFGDQSTINDFKSTIKEIVHEVFDTHQRRPDAARDEMARAILNLLSHFSNDAQLRTNNAIENENRINGTARGPQGSPEPPTPTSSEVSNAYSTQRDDINDQLQARINAFLLERDSLDD